MIEFKDRRTKERRSGYCDGEFCPERGLGRRWDDNDLENKLKGTFLDESEAGNARSIYKD